MDYDRWLNASVQNIVVAMSTLPRDSSSSTNAVASSTSDNNSNNNNEPQQPSSWLDPPNVNRYKLDMEQAHAMRRRFKKNNNSSSNATALEISQLEEHVQLGLQALDQADQLNQRIRHQQPQQAFELYQRAIELLLKCIKSPLLSQTSFDTDALSARLQVALSDAERIKQQLQQQQQNHHTNNTNKKTNLSQPSFESTQECKSPSSPSSWQSMLSALSNALTPSSTTSTNVQNHQPAATASSQQQQQQQQQARSPSSRELRTHSSNQPTQDRSNNNNSTSRRPQTRSSSTSTNNTNRNHNKSPASSPRDADALVASLTPPPSAAAAGSQYQRSTLDYAQDPLVKLVKTELYVDPTELSKTTWADISGLDLAKRSLQESAILPLVRPDLFTGLRQPHNILLYGPPGTGKTMLVRAVAFESKCLLFACSASTLTSKWLGEAEKLVKTLFRVARDVAPSLVFLDELDALLSNRKSDGNEHEASRRFKTEFMIQMDGVKSNNTSTSGNNNNNNKSTLVLVVGCTNCPWDVDSAVLRRFPKRIYIPLPDEEARRGLIQKLLQQAGKHTLTSSRDVSWLVQQTAGCSGSDLTALASEASFGPLRSLSVEAIRDTPADRIRPISRRDFEQALAVTTKSVPPQLLTKYQEWEQQQS